MVDVGNLNLAVGQTGTVDVTIRSTGSDVLDMFGGEFRIATMGGTQLEFVNPPTDTQLSDPGYLFNGDSAAASVSPPSGNVLTNSTNNDTYIGGDGTLSGNGVTVPGSSTLLLHLLVTANTISPPQVGDTFQINLTSGAFTFFSGPGPNFDNIPASFSPGTVTITGAAVPEPASLLIWSLGGLATLSTLRGRRATPTRVPS
jgi:hypothetical protein